jgi:GNAT superfamily N-acetyltransferase
MPKGEAVAMRGWLAAHPADVVDLFVYVVVLNLAIEYVPSVISETFTLSLLTALLLKATMELVLRLKRGPLNRLRRATTRRARSVATVMLWAVAAGSKVVVLYLVDLAFGGKVQLGGFVSVTLLVIALLIARAGVRRLLAPLGPIPSSAAAPRAPAGPHQPGTYRAGPADAAVVAQLLDDFNREFDTATPGPQVLAQRLARLLATDRFHVVLAEEPPVGLAVISLRPNSWYDGPAALLDELYVVPERRGTGIGTGLLRDAEEVARDAGARVVEINVDGVDHAARRFYERHGYRNVEPGEAEPMYFYYRELPATSGPPG